MRSKLLYLAVPLFTFLAFYRFWNMGPTAPTTAKEQGINTKAFAYPAAMTSMDLFTNDKNTDTRSLHE